MERLLADVGRVRIIPYGISTEEIASLRVDRVTELARYEVDPSCVVFVHTGRMVPIKDQEFLIRFYAFIARQYSGVHLLMFCDGPMLSKLERVGCEEGMS